MAQIQVVVFVFFFFSSKSKELHFCSGETALIRSLILRVTRGETFPALLGCHMEFLEYFPTIFSFINE